MDIDNKEEEMEEQDMDESIDENQEEESESDDSNEEDDIKSKYEEALKEKAELEKKLKTALIQKQKKDEKLKNVSKTSSNDEVQSLRAEIELIKFQSTHKDLSESEIKLIQKFRQPGQTLDEVMNDEDVKDILETKRLKKELEEGIPSFNSRSSSSGLNGMSSIEAKLAGNLPPGYKLSKKK